MSTSLSANGVSGLVSGIKSADIIDALINSERGATRVLEGRKKTFQDRHDAIRALNSKLLSAQIDGSALKGTSTFASRSATSSNTATLTAVANSTANAGNYTVTVDKKASAQQLATAGFTSSSSSLGTGTVTLQVGNGAIASIAVTAANSSLDGLAAAINSANAGVSASVINDGSSTPYRLVLASKDTGVANTITLNANGLTGGASTQLKKLSATVGNTYAGTATLAGNFSGPSVPSSIQVRVKAGTAGTESTTQFERSTDGVTWTAAVNTAGAVALGNGLTVNLTAGTFAAADTFTVRPLQELSIAQDAQVRYGTGAAAIVVTSKSNTISGLIPGVTLTVTGESTTPATITIGTDTKKAADAITGFVKTYNEALQYLSDKANYNATTKVAGVLFSESDIRRGIDNATRAFTAAIGALPQSMRDVSALGISVDRTTGQLTVDTSVLNDKLAADSEAVRKLFVNSAISTDQGISFISLTDKTKTTAAFSVAISRVATQAKASASALTVPITIDSSNRNFGVTVNGHVYSATLTDGTYTTAAQLADHIQKVVNANVSKGDFIEVGVDGSGALDLHTKFYGSNQKVQVTANAAATALGLGTAEAVGVDVQGTINGGTLLTGAGQNLSGGVGTTSEGLQLLVTATAPIAAASINAIKGLGQVMNERLQGLTKVTTGAFTQREDGLQKTIDDIAKQIDKNDARLEQRKATYQAKFLAMEKAVSKYQSTGSYLTGQIKGFENAAAAK